jgi:predicted transcriptional regulator
MKTFTFKYKPNEPTPGKHIREAIAGKPYVKPDELISTNFKTLLQIATEPRLEIFRAIVNIKPGSIYELAEKLQKSQPYILKEVRILEALGLIQLKKESDGNREKLRPIALYSNIELNFQFEEKAS